jgi:branched-chain amino acid transport system permease protein
MNFSTIKKFSTKAFTILLLSELAAVITGPPGNGDAPWSGVQGSITQKTSFFGLFMVGRWIFFYAIGIICYVAARSFKKINSKSSALKTFHAGYNSVTDNKYFKPLALVAVAVLAIMLPTIISDPFWRQAMVSQIAVFILLALGLNVVVGFAGLLDLGFVAFYAVGAYATAWCTGALPMPPLFGSHINPFFAIPIAIGLAMVSGVILGIPTLRLRGDYLAIVTLGFGEIITLFANNLTGITGGAQGTKQIPHFSLHAGPLKYIWGLDPAPYYYLVIGFVIFFIFIFFSLEHSRVGRAWTAIREDEVAAESLGINPLKYKVMAFAIGAASAGFAGVMTAAQSNYLTPATFTLYLSINILVLVIFGGMGSIFGVVFGAIVIQTITMYLIHSPPAGYQAQDLYIYIGALLVIMMIFRPAGLFPARRRHRADSDASSLEGSNV